MKKTAVYIGLLGFAFWALLVVSPATAKEEEDFKDLKVDVLKPFEKADPDKVGISEVKAEMLKKADHVIVEGVDDPPRIKDEADLDDFDEPKIKVDKVKPFDERDVFSRQTLPLAGEKEFAGALEFQDLDDTLEGRLEADEGNPGNSSDAEIVENVFQFEHVTGNDMLGAPLFNQPLDPRTVTVRKGDARLDTNGMFHADLSGVLVDHMVQPGFQMGAVIFCGDGREAHRTGLFPLDDLGNMKIEESMVFPPDCVAPAVTFVGPEGMMTGVAGGFPVD
jgi:hypothetical protein